MNETKVKFWELAVFTIVVFLIGIMAGMDGQRGTIFDLKAQIEDLKTSAASSNADYRSCQSAVSDAGMELMGSYLRKKPKLKLGPAGKKIIVHLRERYAADCLAPMGCNITPWVEEPRHRKKYFFCSPESPTTCYLTPAVEEKKPR